MGVPHPPACDDCAQVSRDAPPPLPGGYKVVDKVFFTGTSKTFADGDKLVHGRQGEVVGPATVETHKGKGVAVLFPGIKINIACYLGDVRRPRAAPAATATPKRPTRRCMRTHAPRGPSSLDPAPAASHCGGGSAGEGPGLSSPSAFDERAPAARRGSPARSHHKQGGEVRPWPLSSAAAAAVACSWGRVEGGRPARGRAHACSVACVGRRWGGWQRGRRGGGGPRGGSTRCCPCCRGRAPPRPCPCACG